MRAECFKRRGGPRVELLGGKLVRRLRITFSENLVVLRGQFVPFLGIKHRRNLRLPDLHTGTAEDTGTRIGLTSTNHFERDERRSD